MSRETEIAWAAGLFEGEGCLASRQDKNGHREITARINLTDEDVLRRFASIIGMGNVTGPYARPYGWKPIWTWQVGSSAGVKALIEQFLPWFGERRRAKALDVLTNYDSFEPASCKRRKDIQQALLALRNEPLWGRRWRGGLTQKQIARTFGVSDACVSLIKKEMEG